MKTRQQLALLFTIILFSLIGLSTSAKTQKEFWSKEPEEVHDRFLKASAYFHEDWVPAFADSLEMLGKTKGMKEYLFFAAQLNCHHAFNKNDSINFVHYSEQARELALKLKYDSEYFGELMNYTSFFMNTGNLKDAEKSATFLLEEAKRLKSSQGLFFGYFALGTLNSQTGNWSRAIENFLKGADYTEVDEDGHNGTLAQLYGLIAFNYLETEDYDHVIEYAQKSIDANQYEDDSYAALALGYYGIGDYDKFREYCDKYTSTTNSSSISFTYYCSFLKSLEYSLDGEYDKAMDIIVTFPDEKDQNTLLAELYRLKGDWKNAYDYQQKVNDARKKNDKDTFNEEISRMDQELSAISSESRRVRASFTRIIIILFLITLVFLFAFNAHKNRKLMKLQERELDTAKRYHLLVENAPFGYSKARLLRDANGKVKDYITVEVNKMLRDAISKAGASYGIESILSAYPKSGPMVVEKINEALEQNLPYIRFSYHLSEFERYYETIILFDESEYIQVISLNTTDLVIAKKELELTNKQLTLAKEKAEKSDDIKTQFIQNMSHEIRTPLNAIVGFSQLLGLPDGFNTDQEKAQYSSYIKNNSDMLMMLIDDILDIADAENGTYKIVLDDASCNEICQNAIKTVEYRTPPGVMMRFSSDVDDDFTIKTDARRIQQVIINYLTNACKHTKEGEIHVHISTTENPGKVTFSVTDTGVGVPPEMAENIFERFTKLDVFKQGAGLGLNICSTIANKLGGKVLLDTNYKDGARFLFIL